MSGNNHKVADEGDTVRIQATFTNFAGALTAPTTITLATRNPSQADSGESTTTSLTTPSTGVYYKDVSLTIAGLWRWEMRGVGNGVDQIERYSVEVRRAEVRA